MNTKYLSSILVCIFFCCCNNDASKNQQTDTITINPDNLVDDTTSKIDLSKSDTSDLSLMDLSMKILAILKSKDVDALAKYINPAIGLRFSPYAYIDTSKGIVLSSAELKLLRNTKEKLTWGEYSGEGSPIRFSVDAYFERFVYSKDFLNAEKKSVNKFLAGGNSLNNLQAVYPDAKFTEFYFTGFDPKYEGMDWRALRLVFILRDNKLWLAAVIHDEWTS